MPTKLSAQCLERKFASKVNDQAVFTQGTKIIVRQVEHLQCMVQEFFSFAKLPEVRSFENNLGPRLEEMVDMFRNSHEHIAWELCFANPISPMRFDPEALRRAWINLLTSAVEALYFRTLFFKKKGGTGLGLTIAKSVVGEHQGTTRVRKNTPRGCVFEVVCRCSELSVENIPVEMARITNCTGFGSGRF